jgi:hypothetical protein
MLFFRQIQHLLPDAHAWRLPLRGSLRRLLEGLATGPASARDFIDNVYRDLFPDTTRELAEWEAQFGVPALATLPARRLQLAGAWSAQGGQSPAYLQQVIHAAGFTTVFVHEWWWPTVPRTLRDPHAYTDQPLVGTVQCGDAIAVCTPLNPPPLPDDTDPYLDPDSYPPVCNRWLANDPGYLVNKTLSREAPPPVPESADRWPYFLYFSAASFGVKADVPASRREELERLVLKICPTQQWLVMIINYV